MIRLDQANFVRRQHAAEVNWNACIARHEKYNTAPEHFHDWMFDQIWLPDAARLFEIGCGALWQRARGRRSRGE